MTLHLDHCPDRAGSTTCLEAGWNSVLFDGSHLDVDENTRQTAEVVAEARRYGALVEGEIESVRGVEDDVGSDEDGLVHPVPSPATFIEATGVYSFAPAIGTAHGLYAQRAAPDARAGDRARRAASRCRWCCTAARASPHDQFHDLIARGCAKVNISTALKIAYVDAHREYLAENPRKQDPPSLLGARARARQARWPSDHMRHVRLGGQGSASR